MGNNIVPRLSSEIRSIKFVSSRDDQLWDKELITAKQGTAVVADVTKLHFDVISSFKKISWTKIVRVCSTLKIYEIKT